jgi:hypothetical protein
MIMFKLCFTIFLMSKALMQNIAQGCGKAIATQASDCISDKSLTGSTCCYIGLSEPPNYFGCAPLPNALFPSITKEMLMPSVKNFLPNITSIDCGQPDFKTDFNSCALSLKRPPNTASECFADTKLAVVNMTCCYGTYTMSNSGPTVGICEAAGMSALNQNKSELIQKLNADHKKNGSPMVITSYICSSRFYRISIFGMFLILFILI